MIPRIIWMLWLDFDNKSDGNITADLLFYLGRIYKLHDNASDNASNKWEIMYIYKWKHLENLIEKIKKSYIKNDNDRKIMDVLDSMLKLDYIKPAHKSDYIRYVLLYFFGGYWLDCSTFLLSSFDKYSNGNIDFLCYYASKVEVIDWIYRVLGKIYEKIDSHEGLQKWRKEYNNIEFYKFNNYYNFDFITENYFLGSIKNHHIVSSTLLELYNFWKKTIDAMALYNYDPKSKEMTDNLCEHINIYIDELLQSLVSTKSLELIAIKSPFLEKKLRKEVLAHVYDCGYFFNYLQLYISLCDYIGDNNTDDNIIKSDKNNIIAEYSKRNEFALKMHESYKSNGLQTYCDKNCTEYYYKKQKILLLPADYGRLGKWSYTLKNRLSWENTILGDVFKYFIDNKYYLHNDKCNELVQDLLELNFDQFKFSSYTRNSIVVKSLRLIFNQSNFVKFCFFNRDYIVKINDDTVDFARISSALENDLITREPSVDSAVRINSGNMDLINSNIIDDTLEKFLSGETFITPSSSFVGGRSKQSHDVNDIYLYQKYKKKYIECKHKYQK